MIANKSFIYIGANDRNALLDVTYPAANANGNLYFIVHGFKSFKDWGFYPYIANTLAEKGNTVVKINFSHNGVGIDEDTREKFIDLDAFGNNNFSKELIDIQNTINFLQKSTDDVFKKCDTQNITLIGHSRGGGMAIIAAEKLNCFTKIITLNAVSSFENLLAGIHIEAWKVSGVHYIANARTNQQMPLYFQLHEDYFMHQSAFDISVKASNLQMPFLIIHAANDETVNIAHARNIKSSAPDAKLKIIENTGHTFEATHPFSSASEAMLQVMQLILEF
jgi:pimeloyl-ACP methyl ester carboxylesterase